MASADGQVGNNRHGISDGSTDQIRLGRVGEIIVNAAISDYWEAINRGLAFVASTPTAGVAPGTALSTSPPFVLYNPPGSGVVASIIDIDAAFVSGTLGAGNIVLAGISGQALTQTGTDLLAVAPGGPSTLIGSAIRPNCLARSAPTLSAIPILLRNLWYTGAFATNATQYLGEAKKDVKGQFGIIPGGALCIQEVGGAGSTPLMMFSMSWIEVPIIQNV